MADKSALALGAAGVQVGTRFIATRECVAHETYKQWILETAENGTRILDLGRFRIRALATPLAEKVAESGDALSALPDAKGLEASWVKGDLEAGVLPAGQVCGLIHRVTSVAEVVEEMVGG